MSLQENVNLKIKSAMLAKDQPTLRGLRAIKAALLLAATEKGANHSINEEMEIKILQKLIKQRKDSLTIYKEQNRDDLAQKEQEEIEVIEQFLPEQLTGEDLIKIIKSIIEETGASGMNDMGRVMSVAGAKLAGKAEGKTIAETVRQLLS